MKERDFKVFKASAGLGLKTLKDIKKGDEVLEYKGKKLKNEEADKRPNRYHFEVGKKLTIDGAQRSNLARYVNHSCKPNCEAVHYTGKDRVFIEAIRDIKAGEELTYDYGQAYFDDYIKPLGCRCFACS